MSDPLLEYKIEVLNNPFFRKGFCLKPGFRFEHLRPFCMELVFATDGFKTDIDEITIQLMKAFRYFNPDADCIIPTGTGITNLLTGYLLGQMYPNSFISVAFFQKKIMKFNRVITPETYTFYRLPLKYMFSPQTHETIT
jgi:hypothetical protein